MAPAGSSFVGIESTVSGTRAGPEVNGRYIGQATNFSAPDCKLTIRDYASPPTTFSIPNCKPSGKPVPSTPAAPTGRCVITPQTGAATIEGSDYAAFWV